MGGSGEVWVTAAFRSDRYGEAYIFMGRETLLYWYGNPADGQEKILSGPAVTSQQFPSLADTVFDRGDGVEAVFASQEKKGNAFLFASNECAEWYSAPYTGPEYFVRGPMPIASMFPILQWTVFAADGVDAAFEASSSSADNYEAYLFKGDKVAYISYGSASPSLLFFGFIVELWPCLKGTVFETGLDAAFTLDYVEYGAFIFKGDTYARVQFSPGTSDNTIVFGPAKIKDYRKVLGSVLPRQQNNKRA